MAGRSIAGSGLRSAAGLLVIALERSGRTTALPAGDMNLQARDVLLVQGHADRFERLDRWAGLIPARESPVLHEKLLAASAHAELTLADIEVHGATADGSGKTGVIDKRRSGRAPKGPVEKRGITLYLLVGMLIAGVVAVG